VHLLFVDESGDPGSKNSPTRQYLLAGLLMPAESWWGCRARLIHHRERMRDTYGVSPEAELHASEFLGAAKNHLGMASWQRMRAAHWLLRDLRAENIVLLLASVDKSTSVEPVMDCWTSLCAQALAKAQGQLVVVTDVTDGKKVTAATERLPQSTRSRLVERPFHQDSRESVILQTVDLLVYLHRQQLSPNRTFEGANGRRLLGEFSHLLQMKQGAEPFDSTPA